jgi:hypothetical protein
MTPGNLLLSEGKEGKEIFGQPYRASMVRNITGYFNEVVESML